MLKSVPQYTLLKMSFLDSIKSKKGNLKKTDTFITYVDGRTYKETKDTQPTFVRNQYGFVVDEKPDKKPAKVMDHLYVGSQDSCESDVLIEFGIKHVLSVGIESPVKCDFINYKFVSCLDLPETNLMQVLRECILFIDQAVKQHSNVLVHCNAGVSRSPSVVIGYLMLIEKYTYLQAYDIVKTARSCTKPNSGFEKQLQYLST